MAISLFPRPSLLASAVVAVSVAGGLAVGVIAASVAVVACRVARR